MPLTEAQQARLAETRRSAAQRSHVTDETKAAAIVAAEERVSAVIAGFILMRYRYPHLRPRTRSSKLH